MAMEMLVSYACPIFAGDTGEVIKLPRYSDVTQVDMSECEATAYDETCFCPYIYRPVVAYDSSTDIKSTFANACTYRCEAKSSRSKYEIGQVLMKSVASKFGVCRLVLCLLRVKHGWLSPD